MHRKFIFLLVLLPVAVRAQNTVTTQSLYWIRYLNQWTLNKNYYWVNEIENRRFFHPSEENQLIGHSHLHRKAGPWDLAGGLTFSWVYAQFPDRGYSHAVSELRPFVEAAHELPVGKAFLQNKVRIDNRFFEVDNDKGILEDAYYVMRIRYRMQWRFILKKKDDVPVVGLRLADEVMVHTKGKTFDQNRLYSSVDFRVQKHFSLELGYIYLYQQRQAQPEFFARHVARFTILHRI